VRIKRTVSMLDVIASASIVANVCPLRRSSSIASLIRLLGFGYCTTQHSGHPARAAGEQVFVVSDSMALKSERCECEQPTRQTTQLAQATHLLT
jgi:hypothetical protein